LKNNLVKFSVGQDKGKIASGKDAKEMLLAKIAPLKI